MFIPIRTNIRLRHTPYANYCLIAANILIFWCQFTIHPYSRELIYRPWVHKMWLIPADRYYWQFLTYAFLHANFLHIAGNMYFLFMFGNNVNDKLGNIKYLCFYLGGAIFSGVGHTLVHTHSSIPTLGASGAIAAVTGAYLVLFPQTLITILYWFFFIGTWEIPALWFIGIKMIIIDNMLARASGGIAYDAHVAGYLYGIGLMVLCLATGLIGNSQFDLWAMVERWNRRRQFRDAVSQGYDPFSVVSSSGRKATRVKEVQKTPEQLEKEARVRDLRQDIQNRLIQRNLTAAAQAYLDLMAVDKDQVLPKQALLDIANQLASEGRHGASAGAYEQFLSQYATYEYIEQVMLMLGLIYARYLNEPKKAAQHLSKAAERLTDPGQLEMCRTELARLG